MMPVMVEHGTLTAPIAALLPSLRQFRRVVRWYRIWSVWNCRPWAPTLIEVSHETSGR